MTITLAFERPHLSICTFPATRLPPFTLITGLNGSGKTHLLQAIENGSLRIEGMAKEDIKYFDWNNLNPGGQQPFKSAQLDDERADLSTQLNTSFLAHSTPLVNAARNAGLPSALLEDPKAIARLSFDDILVFCNRDQTKQKLLIRPFALHWNTYLPT